MQEKIKSSVSESQQPPKMGEILLDKGKTVLNPNSKDPIFLLMKRIGMQDQLGLSNVSPFLIQKSIDGVGSKVKTCKKLRNGTILIECFNGKQADKIIKMKSLSSSIFVEVEEHNSLNKSKGTIYTHDLKYLTDAEILTELKTQNPNIVEIKRIKKRHPETKAVTSEDMGLYIVTFNTSELPEKMILGYQSVEIRAFIPYPMRCFKCFSFGHISDKCPSPDKKCAHCSESEHSEIDVTSGKRKPCEKVAKCTNCKENHNSFSKNCAVFKKEFSIQRIKISQKKSLYEARKEYARMNPLPSTYAKIIKSCSCECKCNKTNPEKRSTGEGSKTPPPSKASTSGLSTLKVNKPDGSKITLLPAKINKRKKRELAKEDKKRKNTSADESGSENMEESGMNSENESDSLHEYN